MGFFSKSIYVICDRDLNIVAKGTQSSSNCFDVIMMSVCSHFTFEVWPAFFGDYLVITQPHSHFRSTDYLSVAQHINRYVCRYMPLVFGLIHLLTLKLSIVNSKYSIFSTSTSTKSWDLIFIIVN